MGNNLDPFAGFVGSVGTQWRPNSSMMVGAEFYTAPGYLYTGRLQVAWVIGGGKDEA